MNRSIDLLEEIRYKFLDNTGIDIIFSNSQRGKNVVADIKNERFMVEVKSEITQGNKGIVLQQLKETSREENLPILLITKYIPSAIANFFVAEGVSYIDAAGNCNIQKNSLLFIIKGEKTERLPRTNQSRAFQEAGIKLIYYLLINPDNINKTFRELANMSQIALGSVSAIIHELVELNFILKTKNRKVLKNKIDLLQRWVMAYNDVLRPKLLMKRMSFANKTDYTNWNLLPLSSLGVQTLWGGECAASILTRNFTPANFTIYTTSPWQSVGKSLKLIPDDNGKVELLWLFTKSEEQHTVSPLLIYADLMNSSDSRNMEIAKTILNNELQYLK